ncbi:MAG: hypothetical protein HYZ37_00485 [Candidatus Solibacter usitatus]|nr:hypothetical protein [Candidatus Solibacter usitatus]
MGRMRAFLLFAACGLAAAQTSKVRVALVNTPDDLLRELTPAFEQQGKYRVELSYIGEDPWGEARKGEADLVIAHYGHVGTQAFLAEGMGLYPLMVFANQAVLVGPASDPANVRGLPDVAEAFRRIAQSGSPFLVNNAGSERYLEQTLWESAGRPEQGPWYMDMGLRDQPVVEAAARIGAYALWGLAPFLRYLESVKPSGQEVLVSADPIFQRVMVTVLTNPEKVAGINVEGATAFQKFLLLPATQARIRTFRYGGFDRQAWWPFGRHNSGMNVQ